MHRQELLILTTTKKNWNNLSNTGAMELILNIFQEGKTNLVKNFIARSALYFVRYTPGHCFFSGKGWSKLIPNELGFD